MPNILLVEDDKVIAESIVFALENNSFKTHWCTLGNDALDYLNNNKVDLVLLDVGLPDISGFDVLGKIRSDSEIPVIIITARDDDVDIVLGLEGLRADDYVTKPLSPRVLVARVKAQLRHVDTKPINKSEQVFRIDEALQQVLLKGQSLSLTPSECKILAYLVKKPNQVHSREHLLSIIWDRPHGSDEKTINTHIKSIRKTLNKIDPDNEYIKTHRGLGYSLIA
jgi:two-component system catabolic regulation response regulator CreB